MFLYRNLKIRYSIIICVLYADWYSLFMSSSSLCGTSRGNVTNFCFTSPSATSQGCVPLPTDNVRGSWLPNCLIKVCSQHFKDDGKGERLQTRNSARGFKRNMQHNKTPGNVTNESANYIHFSRNSHQPHFFLASISN